MTVSPTYGTWITSYKPTYGLISFLLILIDFVKLVFGMINLLLIKFLLSCLYFD